MAYRNGGLILTAIKKQRAPRADSIKAIVKSRADARTQPIPDPPPHVVLTDEERKVYDAIGHCRLRDDWNSDGLVLAGQYAKTAIRINRLSESVERDGTVLHSPQGVKKNPDLTSLETAQKLLIALSSQLQLRPAGDRRDKSQRLKQQQDAENSMKDSGRSPLLA